MLSRRTEILSEMTRIERNLDRAILDLKIITNRENVEMLVENFDPNHRKMHYIDGELMRDMMKKHINQLESELSKFYQELGGFIQ